MIQINLLPWRKNARQIRKMRFNAISIGFFSLALIVLILIHGYFSVQLSKQKKINLYLQNEISVEQSVYADFEQKQEAEAKVIKEIKFIQKLYGENYQAVSLLNELVTIIPENIFLDKIERKDNLIKLTGIAQTSQNFNEFKQAISQSKLFSDLSLDQITANKGSTNINFELNATQKGVGE